MSDQGAQQRPGQGRADTLSAEQVIYELREPEAPQLLGHEDLLARDAVLVEARHKSDEHLLLGLAAF